MPSCLLQALRSPARLRLTWSLCHNGRFCHIPLLVCLVSHPTPYKEARLCYSIPNPRRLKQLLVGFSFSFAPGLLEVLLSSAPPTITFFKELPTLLVGVWAVYLLSCSRNSTGPPRIYISSGTAMDTGVAMRFDQYGKGRDLPVFVGRPFWMVTS